MPAILFRKCMPEVNGNMNPLLSLSLFPIPLNVKYLAALMMIEFKGGHYFFFKFH